MFFHRKPFFLVSGTRKKNFNDEVFKILTEISQYCAFKSMMTISIMVSVCTHEHLFNQSKSTIYSVMKFKIKELCYLFI